MLVHLFVSHVVVVLTPLQALLAAGDHTSHAGTTCPQPTTSLLQGSPAWLPVFAALQSCVLATTTCFTVAQRRHLMVWAVFAPKLAFEVCIWAVVCVLAGVRWCLDRRRGRRKLP